MSTRFDDLSEIYESLVDWPRRLAHESPFYRELFDAHNVRSVVDVACGTGYHAHLFYEMGLQVIGADLSDAMLQKARVRFGTSDRLAWVCQSFDHPVSAPGTFDAAICVGNSLALAGSREKAAVVVANMLNSVRVGGIVVIHVPNLWKLPDGPIVWQKNIRAEVNKMQVMIHKGIHRSGQRGYVDLIVAPIDSPGQAVKTESVPFIGLTEADLRSFARIGTRVEFFGGYANQPYIESESTDLIAVIIK